MFFFYYNSCIVVVKCSFSCMHIIYLALIHCSYLLSPLLYTLLYSTLCKYECSYCQVQKYRSCRIADKSISTKHPRLHFQRSTSVRLHISCTSASVVPYHRVKLISEQSDIHSPSYMILSKHLFQCFSRSNRTPPPVLYQFPGPVLPSSLHLSRKMTTRD